MHCIAFAALQLFCFCSITDAEKWIEYKRKTSLDGTVCQDQDITFHKENMQDKTMCLLECTEYTTCQSVYFLPTKIICIGCALNYGSVNNPTGIIAGSIYYEKSGTECSGEWFTWFDSCYFITSSMSFNEGKIKCETLNSHPVVIGTLEENSKFKEKLTLIPATDQAEGYFTSYTDVVTEDIWMVSGSTKALSIDDWAEDEPGNGSQENCLAFYKSVDFKWVDIGCDEHLPIICEKKL